MMFGGLFMILLNVILMVLGVGMFILLFVLGIRALRALDIYIRKNQ